MAVMIDSILVQGTRLVNEQPPPYLGFFYLSGVSFNPSSPFLALLEPAALPSCSVFFFNFASAQAQFALTNLQVSGQSYSASFSDSLLLSFLPFDYNAFKSVSGVSTPIGIGGLLVSDITCSGVSPVLKTTSAAPSIMAASFSDIVLLGDSSLLDVTLSAQSTIGFS